MLAAAIPMQHGGIAVVSPDHCRLTRTCGRPRSRASESWGRRRFC